MPIKWQPFRDFQTPVPNDNLPNPFEAEDDWVPFMPSFKSEEPAVDIYQDKKNLYVEIPLAGIKPENVDISIEENHLIIQGKIEDKKEIKEKDYLRKEIRKGSFRRVLKLPVEVKGDNAQAESSAGMLKIIIPKAARSTARLKKVPIKIK